MKLLDRVRFVELHWTMNPTLKNHLGEAGIITAIGSGANAGMVLVRFDRTDEYGGQWWVKESRLEHERQAEANTRHQNHKDR